MQPTYLPWLGYFELMSKSDKFVIYDDVQFDRRSWQQRNRIRNKQGDILLTVPVLKPNGLDTPIDQILIDKTQKGLVKHLRSIEQSYSKAAHFNEVFPELEKIYNSNFDKLVDVNMAFIQLGMSRLGIETEILFSSTIERDGKKVDSLVGICHAVGADEYYSPIGSKGYIDENDIFSPNGISLEYQNFTPPVYQQINYPDFISHLSFIDYLFNCNEPLFK